MSGSGVLPRPLDEPRRLGQGHGRRLAPLAVGLAPLLQPPQLVGDVGHRQVHGARAREGQRAVGIEVRNQRGELLVGAALATAGGGAMQPPERREEVVAAALEEHLAQQVLEDAAVGRRPRLARAPPPAAFR